jgi:hypothetical protein
MSKLDDLVPFALATANLSATRPALHAPDAARARGTVARSAGPDPSQLAANRSQFYSDLPGYLPQNRELAGHSAHAH